MAGCIHDYRLLDMQGRTTYAGDGSATSIMVARFFCARCLHIEPRTV